MTMDKFMEATYMTALNCGLEIVPFDVAARVMAILYLYGNNENFVYSPKFNVERKFIQAKYRLNGGESPDADFVRQLRFHIKDLETYAESHPDDRCPKWAKDLISKRYGFKLIY